MNTNSKRLLITLLIAWVSLALLGVILIKIFIPKAHITSWWRSFAKNKAVGSKYPYTSRHLWAWAFDIVPATKENETAMRKIFPKVLNEGDHIHGQWI